MSNPLPISEISVESPAFENNKNIPARFTCDGENINPKLLIYNIPENTQSLTIIMDDPAAPGGTWVHWVVFNIPVGALNQMAFPIEENNTVGSLGKNSWDSVSYGGPCPPSGIHRYKFKAFALDAKINFAETPTKEDLEVAMKGHILAKGELVGIYQKTN
jgi:Raf kinase inhibitor-like YbhB/YbcL family protein